jgi:hypothetical protein
MSFVRWVTSEPLEVVEAKEALREAIPELDHYFKKEQIKIIYYKDWYLLGASLMPTVCSKVGWKRSFDKSCTLDT